MPLPANARIPNRSWWITAGIASKFCLYGLFLYLQAVNYNHSPLSAGGTWQLYTGAFDTKSYVLPVENLLASGEYIEDFNEPLSRVIRMPGYGMIYLLFRLAADEETAKNLLVLLQIIVSGVATYCLAFVGYRLTGKPFVFYATFLLYALSAFVSMYDRFVLTESLTTNCIIFSLYFTLFATRLSERGRLEAQYGHLFAAGGLLTLAVFMRPVVIFLFVPYAAFILYSAWPAGRRQASWLGRLKGAAAPLAVFGLVFLLSEAAWVARNYAALGKFVPAQYNSWAQVTREPEKNVEYYALNWIRTVGEDCVFYEPNSLASWLFASEFCSKDYQLPANIYGAGYGQASLIQLKERFLNYKEKYGLFSSALHIYDKEGLTRTDSARMRQEAVYLNNTFDAYTNSYVRTHPFDYYFVNRVKLVKPFIVHSGVGVMPFKSFSTLVREKALVQLSLKVFWASLYWLVLVAGMAGGLYFLVKPTPGFVLVAACIACGIVVFPFLVQIVDTRFLCLVYPFLTLAAGVVTGTALTRFLHRARRHRQSPATSAAVH